MSEEDGRGTTRGGDEGGTGGRGRSESIIARRRPAAQPGGQPSEAKGSRPAAPPRGGRAAPEPTGAGTLGGLRALLEQQGRALADLREGFASLERRVEQAGTRPRLGVFVDVPNLLYGQDADERPINAGKLLALLSRDRELVRATAYSPVSDDPSEPIEQQKFVAPFVPYEYRIVTKPLKRFADGSIKGNFDVEMAIDV